MKVRIVPMITKGGVRYKAQYKVWWWWETCREMFNLDAIYETHKEAYEFLETHYGKRMKFEKWEGY